MKNLSAAHESHPDEISISPTPYKNKNTKKTKSIEMLRETTKIKELKIPK